MTKHSNIRLCGCLAYANHHISFRDGNRRMFPHHLNFINLTIKMNESSQHSSWTGISILSFKFTLIYSCVCSWKDVCEPWACRCSWRPEQGVRNWNYRWLWTAMLVIKPWVLWKNSWCSSQWGHLSSTLKLLFLTVPWWLLLIIMVFYTKKISWKLDSSLLWGPTMGRVFTQKWSSKENVALPGLLLPTPHTILLSFLA